MNNALQYKGYYGSVQYSHEDNLLYGKLLGIDSLVSYDGHDLKELQDSFKEAVDDYLSDCSFLNITPEIPSVMSGFLPQKTDGLLMDK